MLQITFLLTAACVRLSFRPYRHNFVNQFRT